jgi:hypothetical protein
MKINDITYYYDETMVLRHKSAAVYKQSPSLLLYCVVLQGNKVMIRSIVKFCKSRFHI